MRSPLTHARRTVASFLASALVLSGVALGFSGSASAVVPDVINDPPVAPYILTVFPGRDFVSATGFSPSSTVDVEVWRGTALAGFVNGLVPDATGLVEVNHPGAACWTTSTPDIKAGDVVRYVEHIPATATAPSIVVAQQTFAADLTIDPNVTLIGTDSVQVRGTARDAAGRPMPLTDFGHDFIGSSADPFDLSGTRRLAADSTGALNGSIVRDPADPSGWVATYVNLSAHDVDLILNGATSSVQWIGRAGAGTESTIVETGVANGPQAPCTSPAAGPAVSTPATVLFSAANVGVAAGVAPTSTITLTNVGHDLLGALHPTAASTTGDFSIVTDSCAGTTVPVGGTCSIVVRFRPTAAGTRSGTLTVPSDISNGSTSVALVGAGFATGVATALVYPSATSVNFGTLQPLLSTATNLIAVTNIGNAAATLGAVTLGGANAADWSTVAGATTCGATLAANASCTIGLVFTPQTAGARAATVSLTVAGSTSVSVNLVGEGLVTAGVIEPPADGITLIGFSGRDFVSTSGWLPHETVEIELLRHNVVVGYALPFQAGADGIAEVNHPGAACWEGTTPNMRGGDKIRATSASGKVYQALVAGLTIAAPISTAPGVVEIHGTADNGGVAIPLAELSAELTASTADPFELTGRRRITAPGEGTFSMDPISATNPDGLNWTAVWKGLSDADVAKATNGVATPAVVWAGRGGLLAEITIHEFGQAKGPWTPACGAAAGPDADLQVTPGSVQFPIRQAPRTGFAGTTVVSNVTVLSNGTAPLRISSVSFAGTDSGDFSEVNVTGQSCPKNTDIAVGTSCIVRVRFSPKAVGARSGQLVIKSNVVGTNTNVALSGTGAAAATGFLTMTPDPVAFAERGVNLATTKTITVRNVGEAAIGFSVPANAISGTHAADFTVASNTCGSSIAASGSCSVVIRFRPQAVGSRTGTFTVTTNVATQPTVAVSLQGLSLSSGGFFEPPNAPRLLSVFPVRDYFFSQGFEQGDYVTVQVLRAGRVIGESANIIPLDDPNTANFDGIVEVNHVGGACWTTNTPDIMPGDIVRTQATDAFGVVQVRNGVRVQDQTTVQDLVVTQRPVAVDASTVVVKGYANDLTAVAGTRIPESQIQVRLTGAGVTTFDKNGRSNLRTGAGLEGTLVYEGATNVWVATFSGLSAADVALATDPTTRNVAIWLGRNPVALNEATHYEWGEAAGPQPPCNAAPLNAPLTVGVGFIDPVAPGIPGEGGFVDFGVVNRTATSTAQTVTLTNTGTASMQITSIRTDLGLDTTNFVVATANNLCAGATVNVGASCTFGVQFAPAVTGATVGEHWGDVVIYSTGADGKHQVTLHATVPAAPTITSVSPAPNAPRGGTVTINGANLNNLTSIRFVGTNATAGIGTVVTPTSSGTLPGVATGSSVWAVLPTNVPVGGTYSLRVTTLGGTVTSTQTVTAFGTAPTLTAFTPTSGAAGTTVTITGTGFQNGLTPAASVVTSVTFGGVPAASFTVLSNTSLTAVSPAGGIDGRIQVTTSVGTVTSVGTWDAFGIPTVQAVTPTPARPGSVMTVVGTEFLGLRALSLNGTAIAGATVNAAGTIITFTLPATATNGVLSMTARGGVGTSNLLIVQANPTITSFTPTSAGAGVGAVVTVTGRNFVNVTDVTVGGVAAPFTVVNANTLTFTVPAGAATGRIIVGTAFGRVTAGTNFTVIPPPTITAFTPASRPLTATTSTRMTISGTNLATATSVTLFINGTLTKYVITTFVSRAATSVVINTPAIMAPGLYQVRVDTPGGFGLSPTAFRSL
jgi:hypothetical protein